MISLLLKHVFNLSDELPEHTMAAKTLCGGGGVFSVGPTDVLTVGTSSNIGAYGVVAAIALLKNDASLCHTPEEEEALHHVDVGLGLVDGGGGDRIPWCDGRRAGMPASSRPRRSAANDVTPRPARP